MSKSGDDTAIETIATQQLVTLRWPPNSDQRASGPSQSSRLVLRVAVHLPRLHRDKSHRIAREEWQNYRLPCGEPQVAFVLH